MKMKMIVTAAIAMLAPSAYAQTFSLPNGCEAYLTIQSKDCSVSHHFRCDVDPEGNQRRADLNEEQITYVGRIDAEGQWLESFHMLSGHSERMGTVTDAQSLTELFATQRDTWDFVTESNEIGPTRYVGEDRLSGEEIVIDGVRLLRTEYDIQSINPDGTVQWRAEGREFVSEEWRMFLSGESSYITSDEQFDSDGTPVEFIFPGEPGFLSVNPKYGCGAMMSSYEISP